MFYLFFGENLVLCRQILDYIHIKSFFHYETSRPRSGGVAAPLVDRLKHRKTIFASALVVIFTESRSRMNDSRTVFDGHVIHAGDKESLFVSLNKRHKLLIFDVFESRSLHRIEDLVFAFSKDFISQMFRNVEDVSFFIAFCHSRFYIIYVRTYRQSRIGGESPRRGGPRQEIFVFCSRSPEFYCECIGLYHLVALGYFVGSQTRSAARAVRKYLVSFVYESFIKEFL